MRIDRPTSTAQPTPGHATPGCQHPASTAVGGDSFERYQAGAFAAIAVVTPTGLGELRSFGRLPEVNPDDPASWQRFHQAESQRVSGGRAGVLDLGAANPWAVRDGAFEERIAVGWALQQNPHAQYDADRQTFFVADAAGNQRDIATLDDMRQVVHANGGFHNSNGAAMQAVGAALTQRVEAARQPGEPMAAVFVGAAVEGDAALAATAGQGRDRGLETMLARFLELLRSLFGGSGQAGGAPERRAGRHSGTPD